MHQPMVHLTTKEQIVKREQITSKWLITRGESDTAGATTKESQICGGDKSDMCVERAEEERTRML